MQGDQLCFEIEVLINDALCQCVHEHHADFDWYGKVSVVGNFLLLYFTEEQVDS